LNLKQMETDIRKLKLQMASVANTTVEGYTRIESGGGVAFGEGAKRILPAYIAPKTIVIIKNPVATESTLLVREAKYTNIPPQKCTGADPNVCYYEWVYPDFEVYPPLGKEAIDYDGDEWTTQIPDNPLTKVVEGGLAPPTIDTVFHRCHREHEVWVLDLQAGGGGGGIRPARVLSVGTSTVNVQPYKRSGTAWVTDGASKNVFLWGDQTGSDFTTLIGDMIPLIVLGGEEYALQYFWMFTKTPSAGITRGDCAL
jgi:hypothetical protein